MPYDAEGALKKLGAYRRQLGRSLQRDQDDWWLAYEPENDTPHVKKGQSVCDCAHDPCVCYRIEERERYERESWGAITL